MRGSLSPLDASEGRTVSWSLIVRVGLILIACGVAAICVRECSTIADMEAYYIHTLGGRPLPQATQWVIEYRAAFLIAAFFIPGAALATFLQHDHGLANGTLVGLILFGALHALFVHVALRIPLTTTLMQLGTGP